MRNKFANGVCKTRDSSRTRHFHVDVSNPKENNYNLNDQHINIDSEFREELKRRNDNNIDEFYPCLN